MTFIFVLVGWIFSLCLHEFAHAAVAFAGGDTSVREKGYLTFNPLRYVDPIASLFVPLVFLLLGGIGLLLAAGGIYGVVSYVVGQRTQEIGVRMALGATPASVVRLLMQQSMKPVALGAVLGLLAALHASGRPNLVLLDDLDRGLHPKAQKELISLLRGLLDTVYQRFVSNPQVRQLIRLLVASGIMLAPQFGNATHLLLSQPDPLGTQLPLLLVFLLLDRAPRRRSRRRAGCSTGSRCRRPCRRAPPGRA